MGRWITTKYGAHVWLENEEAPMNDIIRQEASKNSIVTINDDTFEEKEAKHKYIKNEQGQVVGQLDYYIQNDEAIVERLNVYKDYRRKGYGTKLMKDLQREVGDKDINFDMMTPDGKALIDKIGIITEETKGKYGVSHYKGRIKR